MKTALITGDCGFVGTHLVKHLAHLGWGIAGFDTVTAIHHDLLNYETLRTVVEYHNPDYVFHLAAQAYVAESVTDPARTLDVNLIGTHNLLRALRATGSQARVLLAGTSEEYGYETQPDAEVSETSPCFPMTVYGVSKLAATTLGQVYAQQYGMHIVCTRAWNHTGPGQPSRYALSAFARRIADAELTGEPIQVGNLDAMRNFTDVRDIVRAYVAVIDAEPGIYNVASVWSGKMSWFLDVMCEYASQPVSVVQDPSLWRPSRSEHFPLPLTSKLQTHTGWEAEIPIRDTMQDLLQYWKDQR